MQCADLCICESVCVEEGQEGERQKENLEIYVYGHIQFTSMCFYELE